MSSGNIVKLNIGGTVFQTSKSTLTKFDGFFKTMLDTGVPVEKDETGSIFIDRDPKHFRLILNYMRDGSVEIPDSKVDIQEIQVEAQYYLLDGLVKLCNSQKSITYEKKDRCLETGLLDGLVELCKSKIPEELAVQLPIIESDTHLLNLIASAEITGKRVLVIYKNIAGKINDSEPTFNIKTFMEKHKDNFDILFRALNPTDEQNSYSKSKSIAATGSLATIEGSLERITRAFFSKN